MKKGIFIGLMAAALIGAGAVSQILAAGPDATDQGGAMQSPGASGQGQKLMSVEVTEVDKAKGTVQIKKKEGTQETFKLDESAKAKLDDIRKGDKVDIEVVERNGEKIATSLMKSG